MNRVEYWAILNSLPGRWYADVETARNQRYGQFVVNSGLIAEILQTLPTDTQETIFYSNDFSDVTDILWSIEVPQ